MHPKVGNKNQRLIFDMDFNLKKSSKGKNIALKLQIKSRKIPLTHSAL